MWARAVAAVTGVSSTAWVVGLVLAAGVAAAGGFYFAAYQAGQEAVERRAIEQANRKQEAADDAGMDYRGSGGARQRLREGTF